MLDFAFLAAGLVFFLLAIGYVAACARFQAMLDYVVAGFVTAGIAAYLVYALIRPERF